MCETVAIINLMMLLLFQNIINKSQADVCSSSISSSVMCTCIVCPCEMKGQHEVCERIRTGILLISQRSWKISMRNLQIPSFFCVITIGCSDRSVPDWRMDIIMAKSNVRS
ncbi:hypothetical protein PENTCL1PPCAC_14359, partial [Pristionchus entomophagus]